MRWARCGEGISWWENRSVGSIRFIPGPGWKTEYQPPRLGPHAIPAPRRPRTLEDSKPGARGQRWAAVALLPRGLDQGRRRARSRLAREPEACGPRIASGTQSWRGWRTKAPAPSLRLKWGISIHHPPARFLIRVRARGAHIGGGGSRGGTGRDARRPGQRARARGGEERRELRWRLRRREGEGWVLDSGGGEGRGGRGDGKRGRRGRGLGEPRKTTTREKLVFLHFTN